MQIHQTIARFLPTDGDVARYVQVCETTRVAINSSVWRERLISKFDMIDKICGKDNTPEKFEEIYRERRERRGQFICFDLQKYSNRLDSKAQTWQLEQQQLVLNTLKELILGETNS